MTISGAKLGKTIRGFGIVGLVGGVATSLGIDIAGFLGTPGDPNLLAGSIAGLVGGSAAVVDLFNQSSQGKTLQRAARYLKALGRERAVDLEAIADALRQAGVAEHIVADHTSKGPLHGMLVLIHLDQKKQLDAFLDKHRELANELTKALADRVEQLRILGSIALSELLALQKVQDERHEQVMTAVAELQRFARESKKRPVLDLVDLRWDEKRRDIDNPFVASARRVPMVGRSAEMAELWHFLNEDDGPNTRWWLWHGPGGYGKTRLALELCFEAAARSWYAGFLPRDSKFEAWDEATFDKPTLIVVDYVAERPKAVASAIAALCKRAKTIGQRIRFLLLERSPDDQWRTTFNTEPDSTGEVLLRQANWQNDPNDNSGRRIETIATKHLWDAMRYVFDLREIETLAAFQTLRALQRIDPERRPLYAALAADAIADVGLDKAQQWDGSQLLNHLLRRELKRLHKLGVTKPELNALTLATLIGGITLKPEGNPEPIAKLIESRMFPDPNAHHDKPDEADAHNNRWSALHRFAGSDDTSSPYTLPPLQPDIFGSYFLLQRLRGRNPNALPNAKPDPQVERDTAELVQAAWSTDPLNTAIVIYRLGRDHPLETATINRLEPRSNLLLWSMICVNFTSRLGDRSMMDEAQVLLDRLHTRVRDDDTDDIRLELTKTSANVATAWVKANEPEHAQAVLDRLHIRVRDDDTDDIRLQLANTSANVATAWVKANEPERAQVVLDRLHIRVRDDDIDDIRLALARTCIKAVDAWMEDEHPSDAARAVEIVRSRFMRPANEDVRFHFALARFGVAWSWDNAGEKSKACEACREVAGSMHELAGVDASYLRYCVSTLAFARRLGCDWVEGFAAEHGYELLPPASPEDD
ncbi:MAG: hypothetical protein AAGD32_09155 [Planctomycetota bacterium]